MSEHTPTSLSPVAEEPGDAALAARLSSHLRAQLDPHLGRSTEAFRLFALAEERTGKRRANVTPPRPVWRGGPWTFALVRSALAASLALLVSGAAPLLRGHADAATSRGPLHHPVDFTPVSGAPVVRSDSTTHAHFY